VSYDLVLTLIINHLGPSHVNSIAVIAFVSPAGRLFLHFGDKPCHSLGTLGLLRACLSWVKERQELFWGFCGRQVAKRLSSPSWRVLFGRR